MRRYPRRFISPLGWWFAARLEANPWLLEVLDARLTGAWYGALVSPHRPVPRRPVHRPAAKRVADRTTPGLAGG